LEEKRTQMKLPISQAQKLEYAYFNWQIVFYPILKFPKLSKYCLSITELILQAKTWGKSNPEVLLFLKALCSIACLRSILKGYQPDTFPYGFHMV
jgi:hypothetical protein